MSRLPLARSTALAAALALAACGGGDKQAAGGGKGGPGAMGPVQVGYVVVQPSSVPMLTELAGRTSAYESSEVRPQVSGIIQKRFFKEGSIVRQGQPLYQIDPRAYVAATNQAKANLQSAQANAQATRILEQRYKPLADMQAVAAQDYTNAVASARQATASVAQNRASLDSANLNLKFTTVPAPISGRIGRSLFTVGALVTASQTDPLTTIQRLDPIYVDIQQSSADLLALRRQLAQGGSVPAEAVVHLKLEDGSDYGYTGSVEFAETLVDQSTGTVTVRARFPNPDGLLLPGMFVRAQFAQSINQNAFLVPQAGVARDPKGQASVLLVGPNNKAVTRNVTVARAVGADWVVTSGLKPGDKVIVQGTGKAKPGMQIVPVPANTPQKLQPPSPEQMKQMSKAKGGAG